MMKTKFKIDSYTELNLMEILKITIYNTKPTKAKYNSDFILFKIHLIQKVDLPTKIRVSW